MRIIIFHHTKFQYARYCCVLLIAECVFQNFSSYAIKTCRGFIVGTDVQNIPRFLLRLVHQNQREIEKVGISVIMEQLT